MNRGIFNSSIVNKLSQRWVDPEHHARNSPLWTDMNKLKRFQDLSLYLRNTVKHSLLQVSNQTSFTSWKFILWCKHVMQPSDTVEDPEVLIMALAIERPGSFLFSFFSYSFPTLSISFVIFVEWAMMGHDGPWWAMGVQNCCAVTLWLPRSHRLSEIFGVLLRWSGCHIALDWGSRDRSRHQWTKII